MRWPGAIFAAAILAGCATAHVREPLTRSLGGNEPEAQGEFWYQLAKRPVASNDDAFHALLLYADGKDPADSYASRVKELKSRQMLPDGFAGGADDAVDCGTLAVALDQMLHIKGGVTMRVFGATPRYALRAAVERGIFPDSSPNQGITGGEFVGIMQKAEEFEHGNPADFPAAVPPPGIAAAVTQMPDPVSDLLQLPMYLDDAATQPTTEATPGQSTHLKAIVTGTQGDLVEIRPDPSASWKRARPGMVLHEGTEIRTGPKSAIRFLIPADEAFCLDSQGSMTLAQAVMDLKKARTRIELDRGRLREDLSHNAPVQIEEAGIEHDTVIKSPNSALALRGTKVSLFEQASFEPIAVSLTGQAFFTNTNGLRVPFGGRTHVVIVGNQTSPVQQADARSSSVVTGASAAVAFETRELSIVSQRGGFQRGDVIVGDLSINDFYTGPGGSLKLPGVLDFVLQWTGGPTNALNDLNLGVFSPLHTAASPDFVANPPFIISLNPNSPQSKQARATLYPQTSRSGGQISTNSVGPDGLELAFWPKGYPVGTYRVVIDDLVDAKPQPKTVVNPVSFTLQAYLNGTLYSSASGTIGYLQVSPVFTFPIPAASTVNPRNNQKSNKSASVGSIRSKR